MNSTKVDMGERQVVRENPEVKDFQNWFYGKQHPSEFAILWAPVSYRELGLLAGVSESTVQHWLSDKDAQSRWEPADRPMRLLAFASWWLKTFGVTPEQLIAQFELQARR